MARHIDGAALGLLSAAGFYLFFLNAWHSIPLACAAAFACCVLARVLLRALPLRTRATAAQARAEILRIASLDDADAEAALSGIVRRRYPGEAFRLAPVLKHPEAAANAGDVLNAWKANRGAERLVVASTCPCEPRAALYARELRDPAVAVVDSRALTRMLRAWDADALPAARPVSLRDQARRLAAMAAAARVTPKNALIALALLAVYRITGNLYSLLSGLAILAHLGVALARGRFGKRLFP